MNELKKRERMKNIKNKIKVKEKNDIEKNGIERNITYTQRKRLF
jgi:hypothetical protein